MSPPSSDNPPEKENEMIAQVVEADNDTVLFIRGLSRKEKARFKARCAEQDKSMTEIVLTWIREQLSGKRNERRSQR